MTNPKEEEKYSENKSDSNSRQAEGELNHTVMQITINQCRPVSIQEREFRNDGLIVAVKNKD